ncbi:MAG: hypothetical protein BA863_09180 [Desulfovibrio sp. S3730MH75]|nr:MAG: hypothetical protein BA863_09180 [Desulfovibrio sp. S3730MH75]
MSKKLNELNDAAKELVEAWRMFNHEWRDMLEADIHARSDWPETCGREEMDDMEKAVKRLEELSNA